MSQPENQQVQSEPIDLTKVDWSTMSVEQFRELEDKIDMRNNDLKSDKIRKERTSSEKKIITIHGDSYNIPLTLFNRLTEMKSDKSKNKLKDEIVTTYEKIVSI
jgi:iron-sulfur cluster repair protein YtfE (RIC family)